MDGSTTPIVSGLTNPEGIVIDDTGNMRSFNF
jgi:hypothetical protein